MKRLITILLALLLTLSISACSGSKKEPASSSDLTPRQFEKLLEQAEKEAQQQQQQK